MNLKRNEYLDVLKEVQDTIPYWEEASERAGVPSGTANGIARMFRYFTIQLKKQSITKQLRKGYKEIYKNLILLQYNKIINPLTKS